MTAEVIAERRERQAAGGFAARLRQAIKSHGSASSLAKAIARSEGAVRKWLRGESEPNVTDLRALCEATETSIEWLVSGKGRREARPDAAADPPHHSARTALNVALLESVIAAVDEELCGAGLELSAAKRSALVATAYDLSRERAAVERQAVARLVRLAG